MELHTTHPTVRRRLPCYDLLVLVGCNTIQFSPQSLNLPVNGTKENGAEKFRKICPVYRTDWVGKWESTPSPIAPGSFSRNFSWFESCEREGKKSKKHIERNGNWVCKYTISVSLYGPGDISRRLVRSVKGLPDGWQAGLLRLCLFCRYFSARRTKSSGGASALGCSTSSRNDLFSGTLRSHALLGRGGVLWE